MIPGSAVPILMPVAAGGGLTIGQAYQGGYYAGTITYQPESWLGGGTPTYNLIIAPKSTGEALTTKQFKTSRTLDGVFQTSSSNASAWDGYHNTYTSAVGSSSSHPAANYCQGLSVGGFSDWYLPSIEEIGLIFSNLQYLPDWDTGGGEELKQSGSSWYNLAFYWSSSAIASIGQTAEVGWVKNGTVAGLYKTESCWVRAIRRVAV